MCGRKGSGDVTKSRDLRWRDYSGLPRRAQCNPRGPYKGKAGGSELQKELERQEGAELSLEMSHLCNVLYFGEVLKYGFFLFVFG